MHERFVCLKAAQSVRRLGTGLMLATLLMSVDGVSTAAAKEPAKDFLNRLRSSQYFDMAIAYLDRLDQYPGVDSELTDAVLLEKAQTYIDMGVAEQRSDRRDALLGKAAKSLESFLSGGEHPRRSEALLRLGRLQFARASELMMGDPNSDRRSAARDAFLESAKTFETIATETRGELRQMRGARIDAEKDPELDARRNRYRGELLEALLKTSESRLLAAETYGNPASDGKQLLTSAISGFTDLNDKYAQYVPGALALLQRGHAEAALGNRDAAINSYLAMLDQQEADVLRDAKFEAVTGLIGLFVSGEPPQYQRAIDRGENMLKAVRVNEQQSPSVQTLRFELAKAYLAMANDDAAKPSVKRKAVADGRRLLLQAKKDQGIHAQQANELLVDLGIDLKSDEVTKVNVAPPKSLEEALETSGELLAQNDTLENMLEVIGNRPDETDQELTQRRAEVEQQLQKGRAQAIEVLRQGLALVSSTTDPDSLQRARYRLALMLYQQKQYRAAAAVGGYLARAYPNTPTGLQGGLLALNSLQLLLVEDADSAGLAGQLQRVGDYVTRTWPDDEQAASAQGVMIKIALRSGDFDKARAMIDRAPEGPRRASYHRLLGQLFWNDYIRAQQAGDQEAAAKALAQAERELQRGLGKVTGKDADEGVMKASLVLTKIKARQGDGETALRTLNHPVYGAVTLHRRLGKPGDDFSMDLYSTQLQAIVQKMTSSSDNPTKLLRQATDVIDRLLSGASGPQAQLRLNSTLLGLAKDIRQQLQNADPAQRTKLVDAFRLFLDRITDSTDDPSTLRWAAQTLVDLAETSMPNQGGRAQGQPAELLKSAIGSFDQLKAMLPQEDALVVEFQVARAQRLLGNYKQAIDASEKLLSGKPMMLDAQVEAALAYEQWAAVVAPRFKGKAYQSALLGARPNAKGENVIWGWGKIGKLTTNNPKYSDTFFEARYHIALCRFKQGQAVNSQAIMEKSITDITRLQVSYPDLGGPKRRNEFDQLLRLIQRQLNKDPVGLPTNPTRKPKPAPEAS